MANPQYVYHMHKLSKTYRGGKQVLRDISLSFFPGAKIGVLGVNGSGKSTLLRIMAGLDKEFAGEAWAAEGASVGYLEQEPALDASKNVRANVMEALMNLAPLGVFAFLDELTADETVAFARKVERHPSSRY